jgi:predicted metal-dependent peptidase
MNIPENLKVGGKIYTVEQTDKISIGNNYMAETMYYELAIRMRPSVKAMQEVTFLHEIIHTILNHLGYTKHNEKKIDEFANALHMVIVDNPDIFKE